jgi:Holliday junction resolvase RusA-like endonuclease
MSKNRNLRNAMRTSRRKRAENKLASFALAASRNAKRSSIALGIPFEIIKNGAIYQYQHGKMIKKTSLKTIKPDINGLTKGSKICLK